MDQATKLRKMMMDEKKEPDCRIITVLSGKEGILARNLYLKLNIRVLILALTHSDFGQKPQFPIILLAWRKLVP